MLKLLKEHFVGSSERDLELSSAFPFFPVSFITETDTDFWIFPP